MKILNHYLMVRPVSAAKSTTDIKYSWHFRLIFGYFLKRRSGHPFYLDERSCDGSGDGVPGSFHHIHCILSGHFPVFSRN